jgi:hypothetical protein
MEQDSPSWSPKGSNPVDTWVGDFYLQNRERINFYCYRAFGLWCFVSVTQGKKKKQAQTGRRW